MRLVLWQPIKPLHVNQPFGGNAAYYSTLPDQYGNPQKGHPGIDFQAPHGTPVYASIAGKARYLKDAHGGEGIYLLTDQYEYADGASNFNVIYWHLIGDTDPKYPPPIVMSGIDTEVKVGDLIGYADNTGAPYESSGDHLHFGLMPCDIGGIALNKWNGYGGCVDPMPYINTYAAEDKGFVVMTLQKMLSTAQTLLGLLKKQAGYN